MFVRECQFLQLSSLFTFISAFCFPQETSLIPLTPWIVFQDESEEGDSELAQCGEASAVELPQWGSLLKCFHSADLSPTTSIHNMTIPDYTIYTFPMGVTKVSDTVYNRIDLGPFLHSSILIPSHSHSNPQSKPQCMDLSRSTDPISTLLDPPLQVPFLRFRALFTSRYGCFSNFLHSTCLLSISLSYLDLPDSHLAF